MEISGIRSGCLKKTSVLCGVHKRISLVTKLNFPITELRIKPSANAVGGMKLFGSEKFD